MHLAALLACGGRLVFMGESGEMTNYFKTIGYNSPAFKNPCDYFGSFDERVFVQMFHFQSIWSHTMCWRWKVLGSQ